MYFHPRIAWLVCLALALGACGREEAESVSEPLQVRMEIAEVAAGTPQNLVMICVDTVRYDSLLGRPVEDALEDFLGSALHYRNASSTAPWTVRRYPAC